MKVFRKIANVFESYGMFLMLVTLLVTIIAYTGTGSAMYRNIGLAASYSVLALTLGCVIVNSFGPEH